MSEDKQPDQDQDKRLDEAFEELEKSKASGTTATDRSSLQDSSQGRSAGSMSGVLAMLVALIALGVASYPAYELYQEKSTAQPATDPRFDVLKAQVNSIEARLAETRLPADAVSSLANRLDEFNTRLEQQTQAGQAARDQLTSRLEAVRDRVGTSSQDWVLAEVEYLVRMAVQRVLMEGDAASAIELLGSADQIIRNTEGLTAHALRAALAEDLASLKAVNVPDTQGSYLALSALVKQVPSLSRETPVFTPPAVNEEIVAPTGVLDRILAAAGRALSRLSDLVDFRRNQVEIKPILPPHEEYFLRQNLILKLQVAQIALLDGNQQIFETALLEARDWVSAGFDVGDAATISMQAELTRLAEQQIAVELPDISGSLRAVRQTLGEFGRDSVQ
ncbi:MAG: uroporphyrinogen-III C-methyltransferase [Proteobacteria bacterium]|nr:uroporphyrinogen-III C-methyltransferase [Pseudomonadota bacterium]